MPATQERIQQNVIDKLNRDVRVRSARVHVSVFDHQVTLTGTAPTQFAHQSVVDDVWGTPGVSAIVDKLALGVSPVENSSDFRIEPDARGAFSANPHVDPIDPDQAIAERVTEALEQTDCLDLDPCAIEVVVRNGTVTLEGIAPSWTAMRAALSATRRTPGVVSLQNGIILAP